MESHEVYLAPYKHGRRVSKKKNIKETLRIPKGVTINVQLQQLTKRRRIPYFRCIFMRITLPTGGIRRNESSIVNLDNAEKLGTQWVAYAKRGNRVERKFRQFQQSLTAEGIDATFRRDANRVQSHVSSTL